MVRVPGIILAWTVFAVASIYSAETEGRIVFSTFAGGTKNDSATGVTVDAEGNAYVAGRTFSTNFPTAASFQTEIAKNEDCFLLKLDRTGKLLFSTFFGGSGDDGAACVRLDSNRNVWFAGFSHSADLPTTPGAFQEDYQGGSAFGNGDGFIAEFSSDGTQLLYCSYFGGSGDDMITDLQFDLEGNVLICGTTDSRNLPNGTVFGSRGKQDAFVAKLDPSLQRVLWCKILAGSEDEESLKVAPAPDGSVYFSGATYSTNFPVTPEAAHLTSQASAESRDGIFGVIEKSGSSLRYCSYFGAGSDDAIFDLAVTKDGSAIITGVTGSYLSGTNGVFQPQPGLGPNDAFIARLDPLTWRPVWASYLGGSGADYGFTLALDIEENIYAAGITDSSDFPLQDSLSRYSGGPVDSFLIKVSPDGRKLLYSTFVGGSGEEWALGMVVSSEGELLVSGYTTSLNFPVRSGFQSNYRGSPRFEEVKDGFVMRIRPGPISPILKAERSGGSLILSWSADATGFVVERSSDIHSWTKAQFTPVRISDRYVAVVRPQPIPEFFRLARDQQ